MPSFRWPEGVDRIPSEDWAQVPPDELALKYDNVERHGWYANLDPTVEELEDHLEDGHLVVDYSGGTGILIHRLLEGLPRTSFGVVNVDASAKFLRLCIEKFRDEPRVAFRLLRYLKDQKRLQSLDEVLGAPLLERGVDVITSTNAIHLYSDLGTTLGAWHRALRPEGRVFIQSGNIRPPLPREGQWIIDGSVEAVHKAAVRRVRQEDRWGSYRKVLDDPFALQAHAALRRKIFLPPRPLDHYARALYEAGFEVLQVRTRAIKALVPEWYDFLSVYHEGILGWVGGCERIEGRAPSNEALADRMELMKASIGEVFGGKDSFEATWTYLTCGKRA